MSITKFLIKKNIVKNESQANMLMIFVILLCVLYFIMRGSGTEPQPQPLTEEEILMMEAEEMEFLE